LFGGCRVVGNDARSLGEDQDKKGEKKPSYNELSKRLTQIKKTKNKEWLTSVFSIPLQQSLKDLDQAYSHFFNSGKGKRKGQKNKPI
jgi:putative transposase